MSVLTAYNKFIQQALKYGFSLYGLPPTGQTTSTRTGDDGYYKKGYPRSGVRFIDNGDGTITDNATGLMWVKQPENIGGVWESGGQPVKRTWAQVIDDCQGLTYASHSDWRPPNIFELNSILNQGRQNPSTWVVYFPNTKNTNYWSSTTDFAVQTYARYKDFNRCAEGLKIKTDTWYARPVRLGYP